MKFNKLVSNEFDSDCLKEEYKAAKEIGVISLSDSHLFFRKGLKKYYISYSLIEYAFRRVFMVPAKMCCGKGELPMENLVIVSGGAEVASIGLPGTKAAKALIEEINLRAPEIITKCPKETPDNE